MHIKTSSPVFRLWKKALNPEADLAAEIEKTTLCRMFWQISWHLFFQAIFGIVAIIWAAFCMILVAFMFPLSAAMMIPISWVSAAFAILILPFLVGALPSLGVYRSHGETLKKHWTKVMSNAQNVSLGERVILSFCASLVWLNLLPWPEEKDLNLDKRVLRIPLGQDRFLYPYQVLVLIWCGVRFHAGSISAMITAALLAAAVVYIVIAWPIQGEINHAVAGRISNVWNLSREYLRARRQGACPRLTFEDDAGLLASPSPPQGQP